MTDIESRSLQGDPAAFGELLRLYDHDLRGTVWSVVRNRAAVDDVMQISYEKAFRSVGQFKGDSSLKTWIHTICYRAAIDHLRYERHRQHLDESAMVHLSSSSESTSAAALARVEISAALDRLDHDERTILMLTSVQGLTYDEVASIMGIPRGTVASKASRAREMLRKAAQR